MDTIFIAALSPLLVEMFLLLIFYISFDIRRLNKLTKKLRTLANKAETIKDCKKNNFLLLEKLLDKKTPICFMKKWESMKYQIENYYDGMFIPEGETFFEYKSLVEIEGGRNHIKSLWNCFWLFSALSLSLPLAAAIFLEPSQLLLAIEYGLSAFSLMAIGQLLFTLGNERAHHNVKKQYYRFINEFNRIAPVTSKESALILEAMKKEQKAVEASTAKIVNKFDSFAEVTVLPPLKDALKNIYDLQESGMKKLASEFAVHLTNTLDSRMTSLSKTISGVQVDLSRLNESLNENIQNLNSLLMAQRNTLQEAANSLSLSGQAQLKAIAQAEQQQKQSFDSNEKLTIQMEKMIETVDRLTEQNNAFSITAAQIIEQSTQTQLQIADQLTLSQEKMDSAIKESANIMGGIAQKMKESMAVAGKEIALGIKEVSGDNAEAIEKITEQAKLLRDDYDSYFNRLEDYSKTTYEDMEYHVQNVISKITEDVEKILSENMESSKSVLEDYKESNTSLLMAFKEQTNSISLYANEISMDVNGLSENLKNSVGAFNQSVNDSVKSIMQEFDSGLAELSVRIANTVESICDAVEALPSALEKK